MEKQSTRLLSLDILRGITVAGMILVNNGWGESFEMLTHSEWNGLTPCDLVFPFFMFIVGVSCYLSLAKFNFCPSRVVVMKVLRRTILLFLIGLGIHWFDNALWGDFGFSHLRIWAVLQRIALCYCAVSLFALYGNHRHTLPVAGCLLIIYSLILLLGNGYAYDTNQNILAQVDLKLFGYDHLYHYGVIDPEGLLGTIPSIAHVMIGFYCGQMIARGMTIEQKVMSLFVAGTVLLTGGFLLSYGLPINKPVWSPSYVLVTCGFAALLQALLMYIIDIRGRQSWTTFFRIFGVNALALYVSSELLAVLLGFLGVSGVVYNGIHGLVSQPKLASLAYAVCFVLLNFAIGYVLYRRKIYIKL